LWVKETWARNRNQTSDIHVDSSIVYRADGEKRAQDNGTDIPWRPSIHMPRWASRITLEIAKVRVERVQEISAEDAKAEGVRGFVEDGCYVYEGSGTWSFSAKGSFMSLWDSINAGRDGGKYAWSANPWVWCIDFARVEATR
jgi:hypothetical protein